MSILGDLLPGSFRGISFLIEESNVRGGRKTVTHEFPNSDRRYVEDLGLNNELITLNVSIPSASYFTRRDAIKAALEAEGYGTLVHPFYGLRNVAVISYSINESSSDLGYVKILIDFSVAQELLFPGAATTDSLLGGQVTALFDSLKAGFFKSYEWIASYGHNADSVLSGLNDITSIVSSIGDTFVSRSVFNADGSAQYYRSVFNDYDANKAAYITSSSTSTVTNLYDNTRTLVEALDGLTNTGAQGFDVGRKLSKFELSEPITTGNTARHLSKVTNQNSLLDMMLVFAFGITCRNIGFYRIKSLDDLKELRDELDLQYEALIYRVTVSDAVQQDIQNLRSEVVRYLDIQSLVTPDIQTQEVQDLPLTILEYQNYGDLPVYGIDAEGAIDSRTEDLRLLNRLTNQDPTSLQNTAKLYVK